MKAVTSVFPENKKIKKKVYPVHSMDFLELNLLKLLMLNIQILHQLPMMHQNVEFSKFI